MELSFLKWLQPRLADHSQVRVGIGDDAAVLKPTPGRDWVVTTDTLTDGVDFLLASDDPRRIGRKALAVNLSDIAAMAARPVAAFVSLVLPQRDAARLAREITLGVLDLARNFDVALAGGDTNTWGEGLVISVTLLGETAPRGPLLRSGGRVGDLIVATGRFGGSRMGRQFDFVPRIDEALQLHAKYELHAGIDVSDGLTLDLSRLAAASGCGAEFTPQAIPLAPAAYLMSQTESLRRSPLDHALGDGEDFELLLAVPPHEARRMLDDQPLDTPLSVIGCLVADKGLWCAAADGTRQPFVPRGFEHGGNAETSS